MITFTGMKTELFELLKKAFLTKADYETICTLFINDDDDERLTNSQVRLLIEEKILPRLDKEENEEEEREVKKLRSLLLYLYELELMPENLCYTCLEICPETISFCGHCYMHKCSKCIPMIQARYPGDNFNESLCIKCLSDVIAKPEDRFLRDSGCCLIFSEIWKHFHIIPRKMDSLLQRKIAEGAVEMQARPSGSIFNEAKEDFEFHRKNFRPMIKDRVSGKIT